MGAGEDGGGVRHLAPIPPNATRKKQRNTLFIMEQHVKQIPYGVADFAKVIEQNLYYVDKTMFLPMIEDQPRNLFFIRPRRFGKSIFLSMLHSYYDCKQKDKFQTLFGKLWIGKNPTPNQGRYQVLHFDFSQVGGTIDKLEDKFNEYCCIILNDFMDIYEEYYPEDTKKAFYASEDAGAKLAIMS